ncbi:vitamin K epoxide reductase family protein [Candidatus Saccharibacteria bacterium]|jgi:Predicted membrane protein|nr:vitamin K epoxide reductase family protein [Candidatus Saccharibacteria bacterium]
MKLFGGITLERAIPWLLVIAGAIGLLLSCIIMYDKVALAENPNFQTGCDINPIVSCGSVMKSAQSTAFWNIPNPFIGMAGFTVVLTTGMAILAGAKFKRWYWLGLQAGTIFGLGFVHWLFYQSVYHINALCPFCMGVWVTTITTFWYVTLYNIQAGHIKVKGALEKVATFARKHHLDILFFWFLLIAFFILKHFWYYYGEQLL